MSATLSGALPAGDHNGLAALAPALVNNPEELHVAVVTFSTSKLTTDVDTGDVTPTIRIKQFEPFTASGDVGELRRLLRRQFERRTGQTELPLDLERQLDNLAADPNDPGAARDLPTGPEWGDSDGDDQR